MFTDHRSRTQFDKSVLGDFAAGTQNGSWEDLSDTQGTSHALLETGAATGSPTAQSVTYTVEEADDASGTN